MRLPEIGGVGAIFLAAIGLVGGIIFATHMPWWSELIAAGVLFYVIGTFGPGEMADLAYIPLFIFFVIGCIIGDISWAFQTGAIVFDIPDFNNPFTVDK